MINIWALLVDTNHSRSKQNTVYDQTSYPNWVFHRQSMYTYEWFWALHYNLVAFLNCPFSARCPIVYARGKNILNGHCPFCPCHKVLCPGMPVPENFARLTSLLMAAGSWLFKELAHWETWFFGRKMIIKNYVIFLAQNTDDDARTEFTQNKLQKNPKIAKNS